MIDLELRDIILNEINETDNLTRLRKLHKILDVLEEDGYCYDYLSSISVNDLDGEAVVIQYDLYLRWCDDIGVECVSQKKFSRYVNEILHLETKTIRGTDSSFRVYSY